MFELLLQADKSMSDGLLDQAERTYWQLIELDPTNSIAVAGLASISLQRGDQRLARTFADRALSIDPGSLAAHRVIKALEEGMSAPTGPSRPDLQMKGAEKLEALSRRRTAANEGEDGAEGAGPKTASRSPRAGARPDELEPMPSEPLRERRRAGRLSAAAAAAAAAAREPSRSRHEPHRAMPSGRHLFQPEMLQAPAFDPFSEAEREAAVAAVDSFDEPPEAPISSVPAAEVEAPAEAAADAVVVAEPEVEPEAAIEAAPEVEAEAEAELAAAPAEVAAEPNLEYVLEAVDATEARESVALRLALLSGAAEMPAGGEGPAEQQDGRSPGAAEFVWWGGPEGSPDWTVEAVEPNRAGSADVAGPAGTTAEALPEVADATSQMGNEERLSEEDAEMQAFREAMATLAPAEDQTGVTSTPSGPVALASEEPPDASPPRKKGLFRRFRGG